MRSLFLVLITLAIFPVASWAQNNKPRTEKVPSWVTVNTPCLY
jgi:hypothetical protein